MDIKVSCIETVGPYINRDLVNGGAIINWIEKLETSEICIEKSIDQQPVLIRKDNWFYCGAWLDDIARERIFKTVLDEFKIEHENLPEGIRIRTTKDQVFVFNYSNKDVDYHGQTIPAAGTIWFT
jgi:beta-galactosidase